MGNIFKTSVHLLHYYIKEIVIPRLPFFIFETCGLIKIRSKGSISYLTKLNISGGGNTIYIGCKSILKKCKIHIHGNNNIIEIGSHCILHGVEFWIDGNNHKIVIGDHCTISHDTQLCAQEHDTLIVMGDDCMISNNVMIRTSDSHPIFNEQCERINNAGNVIIGKHVWIAANATLMKRVSIGANSIIGSHSVVTKNIGESTLNVGIPSKSVKSNVSWSRENVVNT